MIEKKAILQMCRAKMLLKTNIIHFLILTIQLPLDWRILIEYLRQQVLVVLTVLPVNKKKNQVNEYILININKHFSWINLVIG